MKALGLHHERSWAIVQDMEMGRDNVDGRAKLVKELQTLRPLMEMFGVCRFPWLEVKLDFGEYVKSFNAVTGFGYTKEDLFRISEKVWNLTRAFWVREVAVFAGNTTCRRKECTTLCLPGRPRGCI
jgi:aldehyde:ferredoxin oxidoreductase